MGQHLLQGWGAEGTDCLKRLLSSKLVKWKLPVDKRSFSNHLHRNINSLFIFFFSCSTHVCFPFFFFFSRLLHLVSQCLMSQLYELWVIQKVCRDADWRKVCIKGSNSLRESPQTPGDMAVGQSLALTYLPGTLKVIESVSVEIGIRPMKIWTALFALIRTKHFRVPLM